MLKSIVKDSALNNNQIKTIDTNKISKIAENEARDYYLKLIRDLPCKKLFKGQSFTDLCSINDRNLWWYLPISEKNIWIDKSIHRIYEVQRFYHILNNDTFNEIVFLLEDDILQSVLEQICLRKKIKITYSSVTKVSQSYLVYIKFFINYYFNVLKTIVVFVNKKIILFLLRSKKFIKVERGTIGFFSFFPLFWKDIDHNKPRDIFFQRIPDKIKKNRPVLHLIWLSPWKILFRNKGYLLQLQKNKQVYFLENKINIISVLSILDLRIFNTLLFILKSIKNVNLGSINGIDIHNIVYEEIYRSFSSPALFQALLIDKAMQHLEYNNFKALLFRLEFQPFERAILYNTRNKVKTIGFQHSALSNNFLNYVFTKNELALHWKNKFDYRSLPLPDNIFTSGKLGYDFMNNAGYPRRHLSICGGLRYSELRKNNYGISLENKFGERNAIFDEKKIIFVATTPIIHETVDMLNALYLSIQHLEKDERQYHIVIKHHPNAITMKDYINKTGEIISLWEKIISHEIVWGSINIHKYIIQSNVIMTSGGTIPLEAMLLGVPSIIYSSNTQFSHNPLRGYPKSALFANNISSMLSALKNQ